MKEKRYQAAGGVVLDEADRVLLIQRHVTRAGAIVHEVRLPKGHVEKGETDEQAAVREVAEETGYHGTAIVADLGANRVQFEHEGRHIIRDEHYFLMRLTDPVNRGQKMSPGKEEALFKPLWVKDLPTAKAMLTYASEQAFADRAMAHLAGGGDKPSSPSGIGG